MQAQRQIGQQRQARSSSSRPRAAAPRRLVVMAAAPRPAVMVNSATGKMGRSVSEAAARAGLAVVPFSLVGEEALAGSKIDVAGQQVELVGPQQRDAVIERLKQQHPNLVVVDYTVPGALRLGGRSQLCSAPASYLKACSRCIRTVCRPQHTAVSRCYSLWRLGRRRSRGAAAPVATSVRQRCHIARGSRERCRAVRSRPYPLLPHPPTHPPPQR